MTRAMKRFIGEKMDEDEVEGLGWLERYNVLWEKDYYCGFENGNDPQRFMKDG